jgi:DNA-binding winged helix-turn-helix (wHTH) protein/tetratricopeptide (TPR) repeat protein
MKGTLPQRVRLGVFEVDLRAGELRQDEGAVLVLPDQPLQILRILIEADGEIVTREEIRQRLWPDDTVVEFDHSINNAMQKLRRALVDSADEPHYIGTIAKRGYRLLVPVERLGKEDDSDNSRRTADRSAPSAADSARDDKGGIQAVAADLAATAQTVPVTPAPDESSKHPTFAQSGTHSRWKWPAAAVMVCMAILAGVLYWRAHKVPKLTQRDTIVLADFDNKTGDPVFDDTLKQALTIQLEQSPYLNVLSNRKVRQTLKLMNRSPKDPMTEEVTREVCVRSSSKAMVLGSIAALGDQYVVGLRAVDCNLGESLVAVQERAVGKESVLSALDKAITGMRSKLGESLSSIEKYDTPLPEATTSSLEALRAYSMGIRAERAEGATAALPFYKRAVELDPGFAIAYNHLAVLYSNLDEAPRAEENARKAYQLKNKVSERERFAIEANYYHSVTGELDKAAQTFEQWQQSYPRDAAPVGNLGAVYANLGKMEKFLEQTRKALRLDPNYYAIYANLGAAYMNLNRLDEAEQAFKEAEQRGLAAENLLQFWYQLNFVRGNATGMVQMVAAAAGKPGTEDSMLATQADTEAWYGKIHNASDLTQRAVDLAKRNDAKGTAANYEAAAAVREAAAGFRSRARVDASTALKLSDSRDIKAIGALALAQAGEISTTNKLAGELNATFPLDTLAQGFWLPTIRAAIALQRNDGNSAIQALNGMGTLELAAVNGGINVFLCPAYLRGQAYLMLHDGKAAAAEFQKLIDHYGLITNFPLGALARLGLARAYALEAQTDPSARDKARTAYQNFLTLWKDADPDIPIYKQAKTEYARLP